MTISKDAVIALALILVIMSFWLSWPFMFTSLVFLFVACWA